MGLLRVKNNYNYQIGDMFRTAFDTYSIIDIKGNTVILKGFYTSTNEFEYSLDILNSEFPPLTKLEKALL